MLMEMSIRTILIKMTFFYQELYVLLEYNEKLYLNDLFKQFNLRRYIIW